VKAALISTMIDLPCGCPSSEFASNLFDPFGVDGDAEEPTTTEATEVTNFGSNEETKVTESTASVSQQTAIDFEDDIENIEDLLDVPNALDSSTHKLSSYVIPLTFIVPSVHMHHNKAANTYWKFDQIVLRSNDTIKHDHLDVGEKLLEIRDESWQLLHNITTFDAKIFVGDRSFRDVTMLANVKTVFVNRRGQFYRIDKPISEEAFELMPIEFDITKVSPTRLTFGVKEHYSQINKWLLYKV